MAEINLRHTVRDLLKPGLVQQIENAVGPGTPDTFFAIEGIMGWLELKVARKLPAKDTTAVFKSLNRGLELEQEAWLYQAARFGGGKSWVLARLPGFKVLVPGILAHEFNLMTLKNFERWKIELCDLRATIRFYATEGTVDTRTFGKGKRLHPRSVWYMQDLREFHPTAEGISET